MSESASSQVKFELIGDVSSLKKAGTEGAATFRELGKEADAAGQKVVDLRRKMQPSAQELAAANQYVASLKEQAASIGKTRLEVLAWKGDQLQLTEAQKASALQSLRAIQLHEQQATAAKENAAATAAMTARLTGYGVALGMVGVAAAGYLVLQGKAALDAAAGAQTLHEKTGIAVEDIGALKYAADLSETSLTTLARGLQNVSRLMVQAQRDPRGQAAQDFGLLGIDPSGLKSQQDALYKLADGIKQLPDTYTQAAMAQRFFKGSGEELLPFLQQGADGIRRLMEEGRQLNPITAETARQAKELKDEWVKLQYAQGEFAKGLMKDVVPALLEMTKAVREAYKDGGLLYAMWIGLGGAAANALGVTERQRNSPEALSARRGTLQANLDDMQARQGRGRPSAMLQQQIDAVAQEIAAIDAKLSAGQKMPPPGAPSAAAGANPLDKDAWRKFNERFLSKPQQMQRELAEAERLARSAGTLGGAEYQGVVAQIRERYRDKSSGGGADWIQALERDVAKKEFGYSAVDEVSKRLSETKNVSPAMRERALAAAREKDRQTAEKRSTDAYARDYQAQQAMGDEQATDFNAADRARNDAFLQYRTQRQQAELGLIRDSQARARAELAFEREQGQERIRQMIGSSEEKKHVQLEFDAWMLARERQLTENLKPEWQRMVEAWGDSEQLRREASDRMTSGVLRAGEEMAVQFGRTGKISGQAMGYALIDEFMRTLYRQNFAKPVAGLVNNASNWLLGKIGLGGGPTPGGVEMGGGYGMEGALGGGIRVDPVIELHGGGMANIDGRRRYVHPAAFADAPRYHSGIGPHERAAVIRQDEGVFTPAQMRALSPVGRGGGNVRVEIVNQGAPQAVTDVQPRFDPDGMVVRIVLRDLATGGPISSGIEQMSNRGRSS